MTRLRDGVRLFFGGDVITVVDLQQEQIRTLPLAEVHLCERLSLGIDDAAGTPAQVAAAAGDLAVAGTAGIDPALLARLSALDRLLGIGSEAHPQSMPAVTQLVERAHARRACLSPIIGQRPALPETVTRRALLLPAAPCQVLLLGDDDFTGLAAAALGHSVVVLDVDTYLLEVYHGIATTHGLPVAARSQDLREPFPEEERRRYDAVFTTPTGSKDGLSLTLARALSCAVPGGLIFASVSPLALRPFLELVAESGATVEQHYRGFNRYYTPRCRLDARASDLLVLRCERATPPVPHDAFCLPDQLYDTRIESDGPPLAYVIEEIQDARYTQPVFFELLVNQLRLLAPDLGTGVMTASASTTGFAAPLAGHGFVSIHADRGRRVLQTAVYPVTAAVQRPLLNLLHAAYKRTVASVRTSIDSRCWHVRTR